MYRPVHNQHTACEWWQSWDRLQQTQAEFLEEVNSYSQLVLCELSYLWIRYKTFLNKSMPILTSAHGIRISQLSFVSSPHSGVDSRMYWKWRFHTPLCRFSLIPQLDWISDWRDQGPAWYWLFGCVSHTLYVGLFWWQSHVGSHITICKVNWLYFYGEHKVLYL